MSYSELMNWIGGWSWGGSAIVLAATIAWMLVFGMALLFYGFSLGTLVAFALISLCGWGVGAYVLR